MAIKAIFFDIGDTLVTDRPSLEERIESAGLQVGIEVDWSGLPAAMRRIEDYALKRYLEGVTTDDAAAMRDTAERLLQYLGASEADVRRADEIVSAFVEAPFQRVLHPDALGAIDDLKARGFLVGVISDWDANLPTLLAEWDLAPRLDSVAVSAIVGCTKPDRRLFMNALAQVGVAGPEALHVGDYAELDVEGARSAGMHALLYDWRGRTPQPGCPRVTTFSEIVTYLTNLER